MNLRKVSSPTPKAAEKKPRRVSRRTENPEVKVATERKRISVSRGAPEPLKLPTEEMLKKLAESGLDAPSVRSEHGFCAAMQTPDGRHAIRGIVIPYFDVDGKKTEFWRYRYLDDPRTPVERMLQKKKQKYTQPRGAAPRVYFAPGVAWPALLRDVDQRLVITEGEFKSACACRNGYATLGLGGVWNFAERAGGIRELLPELQGVQWRNRQVIIAFDSDAVENQKVRAAEYRVAQMLCAQGAFVHVARLPPLNGGAKCGLDDFIMHFGPDALEEVLSHAESFAEMEALLRLNLELTVVLNPAVYFAKYAEVGRGFLPKLDVGAPRTGGDMAEVLATKIVEMPGQPRKDGTPGSPVRAKLFDLWRNWEGRMTVKRIDYRPGEAGLTSDCLNTWSGWGVDPVSDEQLDGKKLDVQPWNDLLDLVLSGADAETRHWFECWIAYPFQHPGAKLLQCVILSSLAHGLGKSFISEILARIYGRAGDPYVATCLNGNPDHVNAVKVDLMALTSGRNDWARSRQFVFGEDVRGTTAAESREVRDQLKDAVTRTTVRVDEKYMRPIEFSDRCNLMFSTNDPTVFQMDNGDRRFFVWESYAHPQSPEWYRRIDTWSKTYGPSHLHRHFLEMDLSEFDPTAWAPNTDAKESVVNAGEDWLSQWARDLAKAPKALLAGEYGAQVYQFYTMDDLARVYDPENAKRISRSALGRALHGARVPATPRAIRMMDGRQRVVYAPQGLPASIPVGDIAKIYAEERKAKK